MMVEGAEGIVIAPAMETYDELTAQHLELLFKFLVLLVGDREVAEQETLAAYRRVWEDLDAGRVFGDAEDILFRTATRGGLRRLSRSSELRGHLPPTTADDRLITATGIISNMAPQQRAAVYLAAWGKVSYRLAGVATGLGAARSRDLTFAARQEFCAERGAAPGLTPTCGEVIGLLSARADGETSPDDEARIDGHVAECAACTEVARLDAEFATLLQSIRLPLLGEEFADRVRGLPYDPKTARPGGVRRILRLAAGPAILVVVLYVGLVIFQGVTGDPAVKTGGGRTSDVLVGREPSGGLVAVDSGSGRRLFTLGTGTLRDDGNFLITGETSCAAAGCTTTLQRQDTSTREIAEIGRAAGRLAVVAAAGGTVYLADEESNFGKLLAFAVEGRRVLETITAPAGVDRAFDPRGAVLTGASAGLLTVGTSAGGIDIVRTDLQTSRVVGTVHLAAPTDGSVELVVRADGRTVYLYETGTGRLHEIDAAANRVRRTLDVSGRSAATAPPPGGDVPRGTVALGEGVAYVAARTGGIAVVDLERFEVVSRLNADRDYTTLSVSTDRRSLYVVDTSAAYAVLDATTGDARLRRADAPLAAILTVSAGE